MTYLGDGVYLELRPYDVVLTTRDGVSITNTIYLEPAVLDNLLTKLQQWGLVNNTWETTEGPA